MSDRFWIWLQWLYRLVGHGLNEWAVIKPDLDALKAKEQAAAEAAEKVHDMTRTQETVNT